METLKLPVPMPSAFIIGASASGSRTNGNTQCGFSKSQDIDGALPHQEVELMETLLFPVNTQASIGRFRIRKSN